MLYRYGMRLRGCSIGCQPKEGLVGREDDTAGLRPNGRKYHDILVYSRELTGKEMRDYDLDYIPDNNI